MVLVCQGKALHTTQTADNEQASFTKVSIHGIQELGLGNGMSLSDFRFPNDRLQASYKPAS